MTLSKITVEGAAEAAALILKYKGLPAEVLDGMADVAFGTMRAGAGRHSPRPEGTGRLFSSLFQTGRGTLTQALGHDTDVAPHAQWVIFGSVPHEIRPRNAKMLSWIGPAGRVFAHRVFHPGYAGDNYRDAALDDVFAQFGSIVDKALVR